MDSNIKHESKNFVVDPRSALQKMKTLKLDRERLTRHSVRTHWPEIDAPAPPRPLKDR